MVLDNRLSTQVPKLESGGPSEDRWSQGGRAGAAQNPPWAQLRPAPLGAHPEITDGLMDLPGRVFGAGGSTGAFYVSHDVYRGRSNPELSQN